MSRKWTEQVEFYSPSRSGARLVLHILADLAREDGFCWPMKAGVAEIANRAGLSARHTKRILGQLVAAGELRIVTVDCDYGPEYQFVDRHKAVFGRPACRPGMMQLIAFPKPEGTTDAA